MDGVTLVYLLMGIAIYIDWSDYSIQIAPHISVYRVDYGEMCSGLVQQVKQAHSLMQGSCILFRRMRLRTRSNMTAFSQNVCCSTLIILFLGDPTCLQNPHVFDTIIRDSRFHFVFSVL